eukprot:TRINITY_DN5091_c0_g1_i2.p1 TRINITY_DN5091_c0_g1~~TRINITY_DN5091_c0_g1_i2.p1  ORF type:complete len:107 (+),score=16.68 TRINITY_DN5091_c0_g1_i2:364-684(+)
MQSISKEERQVEHIKEEAAAIERGAIVTASSEWDPSCSASRARLHYKPREGAHSWASAFNDFNQWLQISFHVPKTFVAIATQGRGGMSFVCLFRKPNPRSCSIEHR